MFRASDILQSTRLDKDLSLEEISKKLKIPYKYLNALEQEDSHSFPPEPYCSLIVKDYSEFLGLDGQQTLRLFHRDFAPASKSTPAKTSFFSFTPQFTLSLLTVVSLIFFSAFLLFEYLKFNRPPKLEVNWPENVNQSFLLEGLTDPDATVRVNHDLVIVDINGNFSKKITLQPGSNSIIVESTSPAGKISRSQKTFQFEK